MSTPFVERRRTKQVRTEFLLVLTFWFSLSASLLFALPFDAERRRLSHGVAPAMVIAFSVMTFLCAGAIVLSRRRQRLFDRRKRGGVRLDTLSDLPEREC